MTASVLLDTSFLISLVDGQRPNHRVRTARRCTVRAVLLADGFDACAFNEDGQTGLPLEGD